MLEFNATAIVLAISFVIFVILENFIFYRPLKKILNERADYIRENEVCANENYSAVQNLLDEKNEKIAQANNKYAELINTTNLKIQDNYQETFSCAKKNSNENIENFKKSLEEEKQQVKDVLKKEIRIYASDIISKILKKDVEIVNLNDEVVEKAMRGEL